MQFLLVLKSFNYAGLIKAIEIFYLFLFCLVEIKTVNNA